MNPVFFPAIGALVILAFDLFSRRTPVGRLTPRASALAGIRFGTVAMLSLVAVLVALRNQTSGSDPAVARFDAFSVFGIGYVVVAGFLASSLSLTHFGMARSRPAEPLALLLFSLSGMAVAVSATHLLVLMIALELAWLPLIVLVASDTRRLSSSESSLKAFFAHAFASLVFAHGVAFIFGATGRLDLDTLAAMAEGRPLLFDVGLAFVLVGLLARAVIAPFHQWSPDVHEGAPSFVTTCIATAAQATTFLILLRMLHAMVGLAEGPASQIVERFPTLLGVLGCLGLVWGHSMALVQVGLRRLVGWLGVGQAGFFALALVDGAGEGGRALLLALFATGVSMAGVFATLSSLSHHERACENVGDLSGMMQRSPIRAALLSVFLLSIAGFPGTVGFIARAEILAALAHDGHHVLLLFGLGATALALIAVGRPLLAMLRPVEGNREMSRALTNEQLVLAVCGLAVVYFGVAPIVSEGSAVGLLSRWIDEAVVSLRY